MRLPLVAGGRASARSTWPARSSPPRIVRRGAGRADQRAAVLDHPVVPVHPADAPDARRAATAPRRWSRSCASRARRPRSAAAVAERARLAREMHDVLAHSLSALALQLEGARLLARDRGTDDEVVAAIERAHHLAGSGLGEARRGDLGAARRRDAGARHARRPLRRARGAVGVRRAARAGQRGAARAVPHRPGGPDERDPPQRGRARRAVARLRGRRHAAGGARTRARRWTAARRWAAATG